MLEFGGLSHCVDTDRTDDDGFPRPVSPHDPARDVCRDHLKAGRDGHGGYAPRYLRQPPGSDEAQGRVRRAARRQAPLPGTQPVRRLSGRQGRRARGRHPAGRRRLPAPDLLRGRVPRRARRRRAAGHAVAGGHPRPGRRARAARLRAGRAGDRDLPRRRPRPLPRLAGQARHRGLHQGALLARHRPRRRGLGGADRPRPARSGSCSPSGCRRCSSGRCSSTASRSPPGWSPPPPAPPTTRDSRARASSSAAPPPPARPSPRSSASAAAARARTTPSRRARSAAARTPARTPASTTRTQAPVQARPGPRRCRAHHRTGPPRVGSHGDGRPRREPAAPGAAGEPDRLTHGDPLHAGGPDRAQPPVSPASGSEPGRATDERALEHEATPRASHEDVMRRARELRERQRETASVGEERRG